MSFPRYPKYKDSGVEWLGAVPEHWDVLPLKRDVEFITSGSRGWAENYSDEGELFIRIGNLTRDGIALDLSDVQRVTVPAGTEGSRTKVQNGDVLFSVTAYLGSVAVVPNNLESAYVSQHVALVRLRQLRFSPAWVAYASLSSVGKTWFETQGYGGTKIQLSLDDVKDFSLTAPPLPEQTAIASFLDAETGKIDSLVAEQRRLIELLKEKRQAVISHAVTKGLNPHAPMKPSGIEWLGDVPEHWDVKRIKHLISLIEQGWSPQCENFPVQSEEEWGVLKVGCVNSGVFDSGENKSLPPELSPVPELGIRTNDLLISRANTRELVGSVAVAERNFEKLMLCDKLYRLRFKNGIADPCFISEYLRSDAARSQIELEATGASASMVNIGQSVILEMAIAVPPIQEQDMINRGIADRVDKLHILTAEAKRGIDLLQERRTALISAAVTGKIDVRNFANQEAAR